MFDGELPHQTSSSLPVYNKQQPIVPMPNIKLPDFSLNPPLEEVLLNPLTEEFYKREDKDVIQYFIDHIDDLLYVSFHPDDPKLSKIAFDYLKKPQQGVLFAYLSGTVLQRAATPILANFNPPMISLHRIAHLTYTVLSDNPTKFPNNCGYILQFLGFINELCVCNFYEKICCENVQFEATQNWLVDMNFSLLIANELTKTYPITEYEYYDYSIQRIRHLYLIIRICLSSSILRPSFLIDELFDSMTRTMLRGNFVDSIENERWEVLCLFYGDDTTELFRNIFGTIFNVVSDSITCVKRYHVAALTLLTLMLRKDRHIRPFLYSFNIHEVLLRLLLQFPDHTFLHNAIIRFFKEALAFPEFSKSLIENLLNPLVLEGVNSEHTVLVGTSYECISLVLAEAKTNTDLINVLKDIPEFVKFVKDVVVDRIKLIKNGYGGRIQSIWG